MRWFFPSWNGDYRLEPVVPDATYREAPGEPLPNECRLVITEPTAAEREQLEAFLKVARAKGWTNQRLRREGPSQSIAIKAPLTEAGAELLKASSPDPGTITAVVSTGGKVRVTEARDTQATTELVSAKDAKDAATVKRPTMCCPDCIPGSIAPASEVLLAFLNEAEHRSWARHRAIVVRGGTSGHRYVVAHRHSALAQRMTKVCWDLDENGLIHCYNWALPPEEEVLSIKLMLEHREGWIRNEASALGMRRIKLKNPFGDFMDGTEDAGLLSDIGALATGRRVEYMSGVMGVVTDPVYDAVNEVLDEFGPVDASMMYEDAWD